MNDKAQMNTWGGVTKLFDGDYPTALNKNAIAATDPMVEMSESIENFELLFFELCTHVPESATDGGVMYSQLVSPELIKQYYKLSMVALQTNYSTTYMSRIGIGFYDSTHLAICWANYAGWSHNASILKVFGIGRINSTT